MNVNDIMSSKVMSCSPEASLAQAAILMWESDCGSIPVVSDDRPVGIITDRDIAMCCALNNRAPGELSVLIITADRALYTCSTTDTIEDALAVMKDKKVRRLPVVDKDGRLAGMLSIDDIISSADKGKLRKAPSYDVTMGALKAVAIHH